MSYFYLGIIGLGALLIVVGGYGVYTKMREVISKTSLSEVDSAPVRMPIIGRTIAMLAVFNESPSLASYRAELQAKLQKAGSPGDGMSASQFLACMELAGVVLFTLIVLGAVLGGSFSLVTVPAALLAGAFAVLLGYMWLDSVLVDRRKAISRQFPYFMDLAVMSMGAGAGFQETLETYVEDNRGEALADELNQVISEVTMGLTLVESLESLVKRSDSTLVQNSVLSIIQGERMGTPIVRVLSEQADTIRFERSQMAERLAEEVKLKMQGPAMMMLFSILLLILGPAVIDMADSNIF